MSATRYRFQTLEFGEHDIHFRTLRDRRQLAHNPELTAVAGIQPGQESFAGVVWPSGEILAQLMTFYRIEGRRILELGCGIGLASLVLNARGADISATDIHPFSEANLQFNVQLNNGRPIPFLRTDWREPLIQGFGPFDAIIGSDLLYHKQHAAQLAAFIQQLASPCCEVLLVDPGRGHVGELITQLQGLEFSCRKLDAILPFTQPADYHGSVYCFRRGAQ